MNDVSARMQATYDQIVDAYANRNHGHMPHNLVVLAQKLIQHTGARARIVDIGCGTGRDMAWFESRGASVTGVDASSGMIRFARRVTTGDLLMMDMRRLSIRSESFDGAWCCASLLHLPKRDAPGALRELRRVLKPGGMLVLSIQAGNSEGWEEGFVYGVQRFFARYAVDEMQTMLTGSGFAVREIASDHTGERQWLSFVCVADSSAAFVAGHLCRTSL